MSRESSKVFSILITIILRIPIIIAFIRNTGKKEESYSQVVKREDVSFVDLLYFDSRVFSSEFRRRKD